MSRIEKEDNIGDFYQSSPPAFRIFVDANGKFVELKEENAYEAEKEQSSGESLALPSLSPVKNKKRSLSAQATKESTDDLTEASSSNIDGDCKVEDVDDENKGQKKRAPF